jgi:ABC-type lipoprotein release transport system permease subunit
MRNILRWRRRSILTGLSMVFGYFMASISLSISEGSYGSMIDLFTRDHTGHIQVHSEDYLDRPSLYKRIENLDSVLRAIEASPGVLAATPRVHTPVLAFGSEKTSVASLVGIDLVRERKTSLIGQKIFQGDFLSGSRAPDGYDQVMIGVTIAETLKIGLGDELVLIGQGADGSIANDIYIVSAIVGTDDSSERLKIFMDISAAQRFLSMAPVAHEIAILTEHYSKAREVAQSLSISLADTSLSVDPWQVIEKTFYSSMTADKNSNWVTISIIMAIVAIGVLNAVLMGALQRTREFGLLRAIGTRPRQVFAMIVTETMVLASLGCLVGLAIAWPVNEFLSKEGIPIPQAVDVGGITFDSILGEVSLLSLGAPAVLVLLTALIVSIFPGLKAARVTPVNALNSV